VLLLAIGLSVAVAGSIAERKEHSVQNKPDGS